MSCFGPSAHELELEEEVKSLRCELDTIKKKNAEAEALAKERAEALEKANANLASLSDEKKAQVEANIAAAVAAEAKEKELKTAMELSKKQAAAVEEAVKAELKKYKHELELEHQEAEKLKAEAEALTKRSEAMESAKKAAEARSSSLEESAVADKERYTALEKLLEEAKDAEEVAKQAEAELTDVKEKAAAAEKMLVFNTYSSVFMRLDGADEDPMTTLETGYKAIVKALGGGGAVGETKGDAKRFATEASAKFVGGADTFTSDGFAFEMIMLAKKLLATSSEPDRPELDVAQEASAAMDAHWAEEKRKHIIIARLVAMIRRHDLNGDGVIDKGEFSVYASVCADLVLEAAAAQLPPGSEGQMEAMKTEIASSFAHDFFRGQDSVPLDKLEDALEDMAANMSGPPEGIEQLDKLERACTALLDKNQAEVGGK
jgi:chemotaxis protein histidine kinase CheA